MAEFDYDVVIIGSGAGGGTVAAALADRAAAGCRVAVLEWGPRIRSEDLASDELTAAGRLYQEEGGLLTRDRAMTLALGRAYGGSTVVYTGTSLKIPAEVVAHWGVADLTVEDLHRRSDRYLAQNNVHLLPPELINDNNRLFAEGCERLGYRFEQFPINVKGCTGASTCNLGCPTGAKQGTHRVQLPAAEAQGVEVITNCHVESIASGSCKVVVRPESYGAPSRWPQGSHTVRARHIVVAGGAVGSPALLLRSGLGDRLPALGRYFSCHPALILVAEHERSITNSAGHPKSYYSDHFSRSHGFLLETCMYFPFVTAKSLGGFGREHRELLRHMDRLQMILALAHDEALPHNRVMIDRHGLPVVDYRLSKQVLASLQEAIRTSVRVFFAAGARRVHAPSASKFTLEPSDLDRLDDWLPPGGLPVGKVPITSAHPMGGCRMGSDRRTSVTDTWGRVHGVPGLYVADASLFPSSSEVNPYVTIMALADRVAEGLRAELN